MRIEFKINKLALIRMAFKFKYWKNLDNLLWRRFCNEPAYYLLNPLHLDWALDEITTQTELIGFQKNFSKIAETLEKIHKEIIKSKEFKKLLAETEKYKVFVKNQWKKNQKFVLDFIENELGLKIPKHIITVFVFHPHFSKGHASDKNYILWGHKEDWKNYSTIYIAHELLHILTNNRCKNKNLMHAIIELATDNEFRIRLNKKGKYFREGKFDVGHLELRKLEKKILPLWKKYLQNKNRKNIFNLEKELFKD